MMEGLEYYWSKGKEVIFDCLHSHSLPTSVLVSHPCDYQEQSLECINLEAESHQTPSGTYSRGSHLAVAWLSDVCSNVFENFLNG